MTRNHVYTYVFFNIMSTVLHRLLFMCDNYNTFCCCNVTLEIVANCIVYTLGTTNLAALPTFTRCRGSRADSLSALGP
jgi:hypothetical protein